MVRPFFSIVIPTYNRASDLQFSLYCILRQSFSDFEVIISDNCSIDNTKVIISKLKDKRVHYFRMRKTVIYPLNIGNAMKYARGKYIFIHSDDDFFLYKNSLQEIYEAIRKNNPGYIHLNYICLAINKKRFFDFRYNNSFIKDEYLSPFLSNKEILSFILKSNLYFISGTIFKNSLPNNIKILHSEHAPWIDILFYVTKKFGAYFIAKPYIVCSWSTWRKKQNGDHPVYSLVKGKLESEEYFSIVKQKIDRETYNIFLHNELMGMYVRLFPVIKILVGNKNTLRLAKRICEVDKAAAKNISYWIYLIGALVFPSSFLRVVKNIYLNIYIRFSKVEKSDQLIGVLKDLKSGYFNSSANIMKLRNSIFKS